LTFLLSINFTVKAISVLEVSKYIHNIHPLVEGGNSTCIYMSTDFVLKWEIKVEPRRLGFLKKDFCLPLVDWGGFDGGAVVVLLVFLKPWKWSLLTGKSHRS